MQLMSLAAAIEVGHRLLARDEEQVRQKRSVDTTGYGIGILSPLERQAIAKLMEAAEQATYPSKRFHE